MDNLHASIPRKSQQRFSVNCLDSPNWALAFSRSFFQTSLFPAGALQFLILKSWRPFSRPSIHLRFGLSFLRVPIGWTGKEKEKWDDKNRAEKRKGSLGYPGYVTPVFTKDSKPLGKRKGSLGYLGIVTPVLT
ncbi:hypothetical protein TNCV_3062771 [Trichonephila clavipes]|nr:hypothetical protein TNCV_3062771 [Trichonephila clavipes]